MPKEIITVPGFAAIPGVPFSVATRAGNYIFISGQIGAVDDEGKPLKGAEAQTRQALKNMKKILEAAGASLADVVKNTVFLVNANDFPLMNKVYQTFFPKEPPARSTIIVAALAKPEWLVEIEGIAYRR